MPIGHRQRKESERPMSDQPELNEAPTQVTVAVADPDFRIPPEALPYWEVTGLLITNTRVTLGNEMAFSIMLSRITRELRRAYGLQCAIETLRRFLDTMDEASRYDSQDLPDRYADEAIT
jgi:hypothetical protein